MNCIVCKKKKSCLATRTYQFNKRSYRPPDPERICVSMDCFPIIGSPLSGITTVGVKAEDLSYLTQVSCFFTAARVNFCVVLWQQLTICSEIIPISSIATVLRSV
jgi:hypothetical protein